MTKPKIFVSHSSLDRAFASKLVHDLNTAGAQAWLSINDLGAGDFQANISKALADCEWFILVLTRNALASPWVPMEVGAAIGRKNKKKLKELIFIQAADVDLEELPSLWSVFNIFDATVDYEAALERTRNSVGLAPNPIYRELEKAESLLSQSRYKAAIPILEELYHTILPQAIVGVLAPNLARPGRFNTTGVPESPMKVPINGGGGARARFSVNIALIKVLGRVCDDLKIAYLGTGQDAEASDAASAASQLYAIAIKAERMMAAARGDNINSIDED